MVAKRALTAPRPDALRLGGLVPLGVLAEKTTPTEMEPVLFPVGRQRLDLRFGEVGHDMLRGDLLDPHRRNLDRMAALLALDDDAVKDVLRLIAQKRFRAPDLAAAARHHRRPIRHRAPGHHSFVIEHDDNDTHALY